MTQIITRTAGVDISKANLDVYCHPEGVSHQFTNDAKGHRALIVWLTPFEPDRVVYEATGPYHWAFERALAQAALPIARVNPLHARRFAEALGAPAKTDPQDAVLLARFGVTLQPQTTELVSPALQSLAELVAARRHLVKQRTAATNRSKILSIALLKRQARATLRQIESQLDAIDKQCRDIIQADTSLKRRFGILASIPGIGEITAIALIAGMPELGQMDEKQAAHLAGLAPITRQSGTWRGKSFIKGGRAHLRQALYMPALVAIRFNEPMMAKYKALTKAGKPPKVAITAIMRKMLVLANALLRDNRKWANSAP